MANELLESKEGQAIANIIEIAKLVEKSVLPENFAVVFYACMMANIHIPAGATVKYVGAPFDAQTAKSIVDSPILKSILGTLAK